MNPNQIQKLEETFTRIMDNFDFSKVRALMLINGWKWVDQGPDNEYLVPSEGAMRSTSWALFYRLRELLQEPNHRPYNRLGIGGFQLKFWTWENGAMELELTFNWESVYYGVERV